MKVIIVKGVKTCDVSPVVMFIFNTRRYAETLAVSWSIITPYDNNFNCEVCLHLPSVRSLGQQ